LDGEPRITTLGVVLGGNIVDGAAEGAAMGKTLGVVDRLLDLASLGDVLGTARGADDGKAEASAMGKMLGSVDGLFNGGYL
jgi:uncharacterized membrane protein